MSDRSDPYRSASGESPDADWDAIARFVSGESDPVEATAVRAWLATHPEDAVLVDVVKARTARAESRGDITVDTERALQAVRMRMAADAPTPQLRVESGGRAASPMSAQRVAPGSGAARGRWRWVGFAAAAGLAAVAAIAQFRSGATSVEAREYRTAVGQRDSVQLPDGSTVILAPGSKLTVAENFGVETRDVTLDGAAYFDVRHDEGHPFTVHTSSADIRDIGTAFSVKTGGEGEVAVHVTHGIVALSARGEANTTAAPVELHAGDRGVLAKAAVTVSRGTVTADDVAWTRGTLSYRDASLAEVRADLRRWYGLELRVADSALATRTLTASFRGDSAAQVVRVIALALGADAVQEGDTVVLQLQGIGATAPR
jgi:transmembrane sensor